MDFKFLQLTVDSWTNRWNKAVSDSFIDSQQSFLNTSLVEKKFFAEIDDAFRLLYPTSSEKNSAKDSFDHALLDVSKAYFQARQRHDTDGAIFQAEVFALFAPMLKHYKQINKPASMIQEIMKSLVTNANKKFTQQLLSFYKEVLDSGLIVKSQFESYNAAFKSISTLNLSDQQADIFFKIARKQLESCQNHIFLSNSQQTNTESYAKRFSSFTNNFRDLILNNPSRKKLNLLRSLLRKDIFFKNGSELLDLLCYEPYLNTMLHLKQNKKAQVSLDKFLEQTFNKSMNIYFVNSFFQKTNKLLSKTAAPLIRDTFFKLIDYYTDANRNWELEHDFVDHFMDLSQYKTSALKTALENYSTALDQNIFKSSIQALGNLGDIIISQETQNRAHGMQSNKLESLDLDQVPWGERQYDKLSNAFLQNLDILRMAIRRHQSSLADAYLCRKIDDRAPLYEQFVAWLQKIDLSKGETVPYISNGGHKDFAFPGNGWFIHNMILSDPIKDYLAAATAFPLRTIEGTFTHYDENLARSTDLVNDLETASVLRLRGVTIISPDQENEKYLLVNSKGPREHYSFMFFNEHYANPTNTKALLVPTELINQNMRIDDMKENLRPELLRMHPDVLDLGSMSVFNGGLCNARRPESAPLFTWEKGASWAPDSNGHKHKYNIQYQKALLNTLQEDHLRVYDIANRFFSMIYQLDLLESMFIKGVNNNGADLGFDLKNTLDTYRSWEDRYKTQPEKNPDFQAVLVDADTFDKASAPNWTVMLDPVRKDYFLRDEEGNVDFYSLSDSDDDRQELLYPKIIQADRTLRFYPKSAISY